MSSYYTFAHPVPVYPTGDPRREKSAAKINAALEGVQEGARVRLIDLDGIDREIAETMRRITDGGKIATTKKALEGTTITADANAQRFPKAYKWDPMSTIFSAAYHSGQWRISSVWRGGSMEISPRIKLPDAVKTAIIDHIQRGA